MASERSRSTDSNGAADERQVTLRVSVKQAKIIFWALKLFARSSRVYNAEADALRAEVRAAAEAVETAPATTD